MLLLRKPTLTSQRGAHLLIRIGRMRRRTRHALVYASIIALTLFELSGPQQREVVRNPAGEMSASAAIGVGPLLFRPRVVPRPAAEISAPVASSPGVLGISHLGHLPLVTDDVSLQKEHVRLQI